MWVVVRELLRRCHRIGLVCTIADQMPGMICRCSGGPSCSNNDAQQERRGKRMILVRTLRRHEDLHDLTTKTGKIKSARGFRSCRRSATPYHAFAGRAKGEKTGGTMRAKGFRPWCVAGANIQNYFLSPAEVLAWHPMEASEMVQSTIGLTLEPREFLCLWCSSAANEHDGRVRLFVRFCPASCL